jgi:hypothetical protein
MRSSREPPRIPVGGFGAHRGVIDEDDVVRRLRELGERPVPDDVCRRHLTELGAAADAVPAARGRRARMSRRALVASAAAVAVVAGVTGVAIAVVGGDDSDRVPVITTGDDATVPAPDASISTADDPATTATTDRQHMPEGVPVDPFPDDPCKGPPPFAGQDPIPPGAGQEDPGAGRQAESDRWEDAKRSCSDDAPPTSAPGP